MDTVEDTGAPLEPHSGEGRPSPPAEPGGGDPAIPKEKLAEADRHLRTIGDEVAALRQELARLREEASERAELLVEREVIIAELSGLLPTLEEARVEALRRAEDASAVLVRTEARLSEQAAQVTALQGRLATVEADTAARERLLADLEARLAAERAERENERADARRQAEEGAAAARLSESRLVQEKQRVETLEQELETLETALARHVAGLSELEATVSQVRSEHEEARAADIATDHPYLPAGSQSLHHPRLAFWVVGVWDATSAVVDALLPRSRPALDVHLADRTRERTIVQARDRGVETPSGVARPQAAMREAGRWLTDVLLLANDRSRGRAVRGVLARQPRSVPSARPPAISRVHDQRHPP